MQYRSLNFGQKIIYNVASNHNNNDDCHQDNNNTKDYYQPNSVVNYPSLQYNYARIVEYKYFLNQTMR